MYEEMYIKKDGEFVSVKEFTGFPSNGVWLVKDGSQNLIYKLDYKDMPPFLPALKGFENKAVNYALSETQKMENPTLRDYANYVVEFYSKLITQNKFPEAFLWKSTNTLHKTDLHLFLQS